MKVICDLNDKIILGTDGLSTKAPRITARAIVQNEAGLYAVMYSEKFKLHSYLVEVLRTAKILRKHCVGKF